MANGFNSSSTSDSTKLHERSGIYPAIVTTDTDMDTSLRDRLVRIRISNNVVRGWQSGFNKRHSTFAIRNVEWLLKQSVNAFELINFNSTSFQHVSTPLKGGGKRFRHRCSKNQRMLKYYIKPQVTQAHCVCHIGKYREHMRRSLGLEICKKMEIKIDETYNVVSCCYLSYVHEVS